MPEKKERSELVEHVFREHVRNFGEPDYNILFDDYKSIQGYPKRIEVLVWEADEEIEITTFASIGMSDLHIPESDFRAEIHFAIKKELSDLEVHETAKWVANLSMYPFQIKKKVDWWHSIANPGQIPHFESTPHILIHHSFVDEGWEVIDFEGEKIKIFNAVPITTEEKEVSPRAKIVEALAGIDIFKPR